MPRVIWHDDSKRLLSLNVLVMTKIDGQLLRPSEPSLSDEQLLDLYGQKTGKAHSFSRSSCHTANIIVSSWSDGRWRLSGVIDVENAVAGDPLIDVAKTLLYSVGESQVKREGLLTGYGPMERRRGKETVELYRLHHALEWWDWAAFIGAEPLPG